MPYAPEGNPNECEIVFIGEAPAKWEFIRGHPLAGPSGQVFDQQLQYAGIARRRCYLTNVFDFRVKKDGRGNIFNDQDVLLWHVSRGFTEDARYYLEALGDELKGTNANVIVPMGGPALGALCALKGITKWRGSIMPATMPEVIGRKCVPTIHPANALHGSYISRYIIRSDFKRAKREAKFPEINRPHYIFSLNPTFSECMYYLSGLLEYKPFVSVDVEVAAHQISCCSFAVSAQEAISIPYGMGDWTEEQEANLWYRTALVMEDPDISKLFQNGLFDMWMFFHIHDVLTQGTIEDTMTGHHILYPDFSKSLAFINSLYTDQPYYKDMVKHGEVDKVDG